MSNEFGSDLVPGSRLVVMSNSQTAAVLGVLALASADLARTEWDRALASWVAQHDQKWLGRGAAGFDVADMGWMLDEFEVEKQHVLSVIDAALAKQGWDRLPWKPRDEEVFEGLQDLRRLVLDFPAGAVTTNERAGMCSFQPSNHGLCPAHRVPLHEGGCIICNSAEDEPAIAAPNRGRPISRA